MARGWRGGAALALAAFCLTGAAAFAAGAAAKRPASSLNPANDKLLRLPPPQRAAELAKVVGHWCIGTEAFFMGVITAGSGRGNAYWSLRCADGGAWAIQIDPLAEVSAIGCDTFDAVGAGKQCFKKF